MSMALYCSKLAVISELIGAVVASGEVAGDSILGDGLIGWLWDAALTPQPPPVAAISTIATIASLLFNEGRLFSGVTGSVESICFRSVTGSVVSDKL
jgi:hypothetical protein